MKDEFPKHLRNVHFSLLAACLVLLVATTLPSDRSLQFAEDEVTDLLRIDDVLTPDWVRHQLKAAYRNLGKDPLLEDLEDVGDLASRLVLRAGSRYFDFVPSPTTPPYRFDDAPDGQLGVGQRGRTLKQTRRVWNLVLSRASASGIASIRVSRAKFSAEGGAYKTGTLRLLRSEGREETSGSLDASAWRLANKDGADVISFRLRVSELGGEAADDAHVRVSIPVTLSKLELRLHQHLQEQAKINRPVRPFGETFRRLEEWSAGLDTLELDQLQSYLSKLQTSRGEWIEVFGTKLPYDVLTRWGLLILLAAQAYFLVHLREYVGSKGARSHYPWVGLYGGIARGFYFASITLVPVGAASALVWRSLEIPTSQVATAITWCGACASLALVIGAVVASRALNT